MAVKGIKVVKGCREVLKKNSSSKLGEVAEGRRGLLGSVSDWKGWEVQLDLRALRVAGKSIVNCELLIVNFSPTPPSTPLLTPQHAGLSPEAPRARPLRVFCRVCHGRVSRP